MLPITGPSINPAQLVAQLLYIGLGGDSDDEILNTFAFLAPAADGCALVYFNDHQIVEISSYDHNCSQCISSSCIYVSFSPHTHTNLHLHINKRLIGAPRSAHTHTYNFSSDSVRRIFAFRKIEISAQSMAPFYFYCLVDFQLYLKLVPFYVSVCRSVCPCVCVFLCVCYRPVRRL